MAQIYNFSSFSDSGKKLLEENGIDEKMLLSFTDDDIKDIFKEFKDRFIARKIIEQCRQVQATPDPQITEIQPVNLPPQITDSVPSCSIFGDSSNEPSMASAYANCTALEILEKKHVRTTPNKLQHNFHNLIRDAAMATHIWQRALPLSQISTKKKDTFFERIDSQAPQLKQYHRRVWTRLGQHLQNRRKYLSDKAAGKRVVKKGSQVSSPAKTKNSPVKAAKVRSPAKTATVSAKPATKTKNLPVKAAKVRSPAKAATVSAKPAAKTQHSPVKPATVSAKPAAKTQHSPVKPATVSAKPAAKTQHSPVKPATVSAKPAAKTQHSPVKVATVSAKSATVSAKPTVKPRPTSPVKARPTSPQPADRVNIINRQSQVLGTGIFLRKRDAVYSELAIHTLNKDKNLLSENELPEQSETGALTFAELHLKERIVHKSKYLNLEAKSSRKSLFSENLPKTVVIMEWADGQLFFGVHNAESNVVYNCAKQILQLDIDADSDSDSETSLYPSTLSPGMLKLNVKDAQRSPDMSFLVWKCTDNFARFMPEKNCIEVNNQHIFLNELKLRVKTYLTS